MFIQSDDIQQNQMIQNQNQINVFLKSDVRPECFFEIKELKAKVMLLPKA